VGSVAVSFEVESVALFPAVKNPRKSCIVLEIGRLYRNDASYLFSDEIGNMVWFPRGINPPSGIVPKCEVKMISTTAKTE
jgi:hypothetical protein